MDSADPREPTAPAAEADVLGEEATNTGTLGQLTGGDEKAGSPGAGNDGSPEDGSARPGRDENQAGFLKDDDRKFSP